MAKISQITLPNTDVFDLRASAIPYAQVDNTSTSTAFTATVPGVTELVDGTCVFLKNGVVTSASGFTVNVNNLGAKPCYTNLAEATRDTTLFNIAYTMLFIYDSTRVSGGCWICYRGYDSNTNTIGYQLRTNSMSLPVSGATYRYRLLFTSADGTHFVPANTSTSTNATSSRTVNQTPIDPFGDIRYYSYTSAISSGSRPGATYLWTQYNITLGYSFNKTGAALALTSWNPVYIKCAPQSDGSAIIDETTPYVQSLPTSEDGKIYILLGIATAATTMELLTTHPVYEYKDGHIRQYTNAYIPTKTSDLTNDSGFITSYTETDPTVPAWAKQSTKPTYTATEVGALPSSTVIPSASNENPTMDGTVAVGTSVKYARADHVHPSDTSRVPTSRKINGVVLSSDVILTGEDIEVSTLDGTSVADAIVALEDGKVGKIAGKGLSTNDYTTAEQTKLAGIATGAEVNQNAFSNIKVDSATIAADGKTDTLELVAGDNITLTPDTVNDKVTIAATYIAGDGIDITNGVISVNYPNGDNLTYGSMSSIGTATIGSSIITG